MSNLRAYSTPGLGAFMLFNGPTPIWLALYGHGLDGHDLVLSGPISTAGTVALKRREAHPGAWPDPQPREIPAGTAALTVDTDTLSLVLSLDRSVIGIDVDFSPQPEGAIPLSIVLGRMA